MEVTWLVLICAAAVGALWIASVVAAKALRRHSIGREQLRDAQSYGYKVSARDPGA
jgi:hypothetical protein